MIKWKLPSPDEPGFLRRRRELTLLLDAEPTPENLEAIMDFLEPYVKAQKGKSRKDILLDASKVEYGIGVLSILGYGNSVPDPKGESSGDL